VEEVEGRELSGISPLLYSMIMIAVVMGGGLLGSPAIDGWVGERGWKEDFVGREGSGGREQLKYTNGGEP
jgi:hypothetical protein